MASSRTALMVVVLLLGIMKFETIIAQSNCFYKCRGKITEDRGKCVLACGIHKTGKPGPIQRLKKEAKIVTLLRTKREVEQDCPPISEIMDPINGIKNANVKIRQIVYSVNSKNKTMVQVKWDPPAECMDRPGVCKGYLVKWALDVGVAAIYCKRVNKNVTNFILDESTKFDGKQGFDVNVKVIPYQSPGETMFIFKSPPSPDKLTKPHIIRFTTTQKPTSTQKPTQTFTSSARANFSSQEIPPRISTLMVAGNSGHGSQTEDQHSRTALILSLSVVAIVIIAILGLVAWKTWPKPKPKQSPDFPRYKGTIYVSYLPEKATINQVSEIYSWLKSHNIEVVIDQMYDDQKLYNSLGPKRFGEQFLTRADKVIMIVTYGYLKLCWLDDTVDIDSIPGFNSLNEERLYSEVTQIKTELSTTLKHGRIRFIPVLVDVSDDYLPKWLQQVTSVKWPEKNDGKTKTLLNLLKGNDCS